jgi:TetR/AcrR family transcriptional regulator, tetracycline repressor protein
VALAPEAIIDAAMAVLDEVGLDRLSMRAVADRLGVHVGGLYYHLPGKQALLRAMADRLCQRALDPLPTCTVEWQAEAEALCRAVRRAMLAYRDGARLLLEGPLLGSTGALEVMERLLMTLGRSGLPDGKARIGGDALMSYVTGFVLQEQLALTVIPSAQPAVAELAARFPLVFGSTGDFGGVSSDELFISSVELILTGLIAQTRF